MKFKSKGYSYGIFSGLSYGLYSVLLASIYKSVDISILVIPWLVIGFIETSAFLFQASMNSPKLAISEYKSLDNHDKLVFFLSILLGGPVATILFYLAVAKVQSTAVAISATCSLSGLLISSAMYKRKINFYQAVLIFAGVLGVVITSIPDIIGSSHSLVGIGLAVIVSILWGFEGAFSESISNKINPRYLVLLRQLVSSIIVLPISVVVAIKFSPSLIYPVAHLLVISGILVALSFTSWYKANNMLGAGIGMSLNSSYIIWSLIFYHLMHISQIQIYSLLGSIIIFSSLVSLGLYDSMKGRYNG